MAPERLQQPPRFAAHAKCHVDIPHTVDALRARKQQGGSAQKHRIGRRQLTEVGRYGGEQRRGAIVNCGVAPWIGRVLIPSDDREGAPPVAVMSYHAWKEKFNSDPSVVGSVFQFDKTPFTIVGIAAPGFFGASLRGYFREARMRSVSAWARE